MSRVARVLLLGAFAFSALGFLATGFFLGPELPGGAGPFYVMSGICGAVAIVVWAPWNSARHAAEYKEIANAKTDESASPYQFDLTKLTVAVSRFGGHRIGNCDRILGHSRSCRASSNESRLRHWLGNRRSGFLCRTMGVATDGDSLDETIPEEIRAEGQINQASASNSIQPAAAQTEAFSGLTGIVAPQQSSPGMRMDFVRSRWDLKR